MKEHLESLRAQALSELDAAASSEELEALRIRLLGKKGELTAILKQMGKLSAEERPVMGQIANAVRADIEAKLDECKAKLEKKAMNKRLEAEALDVTVPGKPVRMGHRHPMNVSLEELRNIFIGMGFSIAEGPEVEYDYYNFQALNIPPEHPARDTQDTFYITEKVLLRSQTSPVQARTMEVQKPPIRIISPGRVYRSDAIDATHSPLFHQLEGLVVDQGITMGDLKGTLDVFAKTEFGSETRTRLRPHHFPFTEPSTSPASSAAARAASCARARAGSRSSAPAWCTRTCLRWAASTPPPTPALPSVSASSVSPCSSTTSTICACSTRTTSGSSLSSEDPPAVNEKEGNLP